MKTLKLLSISLLLMAVLSACNLPGRSSLPTQITSQSPVGPAPTMTLRVNLTPTHPALLVTASPISTSISTLVPPNVPVWSVYNYTCELAVGGGVMTMNLAWTDRSNSEEGYKVYRDEQVIATLAPNSTFYVDAVFVAAGKMLSYSVEAFNAEWQVSTSTIIHGCQ